MSGSEFGWTDKKTKCFLHLSWSKAGPFTLENHIYVKALKCKVFQIIRCLIKPLLKVNWNQLKVNWNQMKVNWNQLKTNWFQLKVNWNPYLSWQSQKLLRGGPKNLRFIQYTQIVWGGAPLTLIRGQHYIILSKCSYFQSQSPNAWGRTISMPILLEFHLECNVIEHMYWYHNISQVHSQVQTISWRSWLQNRDHGSPGCQ